MNKNMKTHTKTNGQSLAELALILPLLLLVVMGVFDLGRGVYYYSTIHNAAREGARFGAVDHCNTTGIKNAVLDKANVLSDDLIVGDPVKFYEDSQPVRIVVSVEYRFYPVTPLIGDLLGESGKILLESRARQLIEMPVACP
jgi:Flp pilus assembly protein TadG